MPLQEVTRTCRSYHFDMFVLIDILLSDNYVAVIMVAVIATCN